MRSGVRGGRDHREQAANGQGDLPYSTNAISAAFTCACQVLGIEDLHFHDLRQRGGLRAQELDELGARHPPPADRRQGRELEVEDIIVNSTD
jgi:hypothetical protein